ncbi:hypothetical protein QVD17_07833 [Tagetes erecta]|uniref:Integrase catalytic domain-containing protein n=1 Tax=Tagetes erecta TaxID=13708 RepID=A0AAD8L247_TARER|nr:hypothetical protein QVD17_07833 [Tagetes erecta]
MPPKPDTPEPSTNSNSKNTLHPMYTVTNIQNKVRVLDGEKVSYSSWVTLFHLHVRGHKVMHHIDGTPPPPKTDPEHDQWMTVDAIVLQWIYGTLSDEIFARVVEDESTAMEVWLRIKEIFLNNKGSRASALELEFNNLTLNSMPSLEAYCTKLKDLAGQLKYIDSHVSNQRLVLKLVCGLPKEFDTVASMINQQIPKWETACNMLRADLQRQNSRETNSSHASVMEATTDPPTQTRNNRRQVNRPGSNPKPQASSEPTQKQTTNPVQHRSTMASSPAYQQPPPWYPSPCPYPTQPHWPNTTKPTSYNQAPQALLTEINPLDPTALGEAFQAMHVESRDFENDQWYMDTGASSHISGDPAILSYSNSSCQVSKHKRLPFSGSTSVTLLPFDTVHCDLWTSPIGVNSIIKQFKRFANSHGLQFRFACPQTSQQNGKSERMIRRLNDIMFCVLTHASLPSIYWVDALHTVAYLHNILPSPKHKFLTPTARLYGRHRLMTISEFLDVLVTQTSHPQDLTNSPIAPPSVFFSECDENFNPVVKPTTIRMVLSLAISRGWKINQLDVKNAFLHGDLNETIYMYQPSGFKDPANPKFVCKLKKSLYGLKQAPRAWCQRFATFVKKCRFTSTVSDTSLFIYKKGSQMAYLLLYVDDIILTAFNNSLIRHFITTLSSDIAMTDLGQLHHFLGINVTKQKDGLFLFQQQYIHDVIAHANMTNCKPCATPVDTNSKLSANTRPPLPDGTSSHGLLLRPSKSVKLKAYYDIDWGGCPDSRKSTSGYCVFLGDNLVSCSSKRQPTISRSSAEVEYRGVANAVAETSWLRNLLIELRLPTMHATLVFVIIYQLCIYL